MLRPDSVRNCIAGDLVKWFLGSYNFVNHEHVRILLQTLRHNDLGRTFPLERSMLTESVQLGIVELTRSLHLLDPNALVDNISHLGELRKRGLDFTDIDDLVIQSIHLMGGLDERRLSLLLRALVNLRHSVTNEFVCALDSLFSGSPERISNISRKDKVLLVFNSAKSLSTCRGVNDVRKVNHLVELLLSDMKTSGLIFQDCSMLICSLGKLRRTNVALQLEVEFIDGLVPVLLPSLRSANKASKPALLCVLWGLTLLRHKSQPILVHLYRQVDLRDDWSLDETCFLFYLFQTTSGIYDEAIREKFLHKLKVSSGSPSYVNVLNALLALKTCPHEWQLTEHLLDKYLYPVSGKLPIDQFLTGLSLAMELDQRSSGGLSSFIDQAVTRCKKLDQFSHVIRLFSLLPSNPIVEAEVMVHLKKKRLFSLSASDLVLLTVCVGKRKNRPNLKTRVVHLIKCSIENRLIPTPLVLTHLPLLSRLGVFRALSFETQKNLYQKSTQKDIVLFPKDSTNHARGIDTSKRLIWLDINEAESQNKSALAGAAKAATRVLAEEATLEQEVPKNEFIETLRRIG